MILGQIIPRIFAAALSCPVTAHVIGWLMSMAASDPLECIVPKTRECPTARLGEPTKKPKLEDPTIALVDALAFVTTESPFSFIVVVFVPAVDVLRRYILRIQKLPDFIILAGIVIDSIVTSSVNAFPPLTDSLPKSADSGALNVMVFAPVLANPSYHPAASDGLPG